MHLQVKLKICHCHFCSAPSAAPPHLGRVLFVNSMCWVLNNLWNIFCQKECGEQCSVTERLVVQKWWSLVMLQAPQVGAAFLFACCARLRTQASVMDQGSNLLPWHKKKARNILHGFVWLWGTNLPAQDGWQLRLFFPSSNGASAFVF